MADDTELAAPISYPSWMYGPEGAAQIFNSEDEVPVGWEDHPAKVGGDTRQPDGPLIPKEPQDPYAGKTQAELIELLKERKLQFNANWKPDKLIGILKANEGK